MFDTIGNDPLIIIFRYVLNNSVGDIANLSKTCKFLYEAVDLCSDIADPPHWIPNLNRVIQVIANTNTRSCNEYIMSWYSAYIIVGIFGSNCLYSVLQEMDPILRKPYDGTSDTKKCIHIDDIAMLSLEYQHLDYNCIKELIYYKSKYAALDDDNSYVFMTRIEPVGKGLSIIIIFNVLSDNVEGILSEQDIIAKIWDDSDDWAGTLANLNSDIFDFGDNCKIKDVQNCTFINNDGTYNEDGEDYGKDYRNVWYHFKPNCNTFGRNGLWCLPCADRMSKKKDIDVYLKLMICETFTDIPRDSILWMKVDIW